MKVCIWEKTTKSGIGDRLIDILLVLSYSRYHECDKLLMKWITIKQCSNSGHAGKRPKFREVDQRADVMNKYIKLPNDLIITNNFSSKEYKTKIKFRDYLGGIYSKHTFISKYKLDEKRYLEIYDKVVNDFGFISKKLFDIIDKKEKLLAIHLRRTDKVMNSNKDANSAIGITNKELNELNISTKAIIDIFIKNGYNNIAFISDSEEERKHYVSLYKDKCTVIEVKGDLGSGEQTYIDLYTLIKADTIIMSQRWSNFSMIASILGKNKLVYFNKEYIDKYKYNSDNYYYYKNI